MPSVDRNNEAEAIRSRLLDWFNEEQESFHERIGSRYPPCLIG
jgi:hypothetical protein